MHSKYKVTDCIAGIELKAEYPYETIPTIARERLGIQINQKNILLKLVLQHLGMTMTDTECNTIAKNVYDLINEGKGGYL